MLSATSTNWLCWIKTVSNRLWSKWGKGGGGPCQTFTTTHHTTGCHKTRKPILAKKIGVLVTNTWNKSTLKSRGTVKSVLYYQNVLTVSRHARTHTHILYEHNFIYDPKKKYGGPLQLVNSITCRSHVPNFT